MRNGRDQRVAWCGVALLLIGCTGTPQTELVALHRKIPTAVPLRDSDGHVLVRTAVNGRDAGWFLLDTGSNLTAIERGAANRLGLEVVGEGSAHGVAGAESIDFRSFDSVSVGGFQLRPRKLASINLVRMRAGWAGLLGFDALAGPAFTIDQRAGVLTIGDAFDTSAHVERLHVWNGLPVVDVTLAGRPMRLLLDTGADNDLSLHADVVQRFPDVLSVPHSGAGRSRGVGGTVAGSLTWVKTLELFGVTLRDVEVSIDPRPAALGDPRIAGRVGNGLLRHFRLTFDVQQGRIAAAWRPE